MVWYNLQVGKYNIKYTPLKSEIKEKLYYYLKKNELFNGLDLPSEENGNKWLILNESELFNFKNFKSVSGLQKMICEEITRYIKGNFNSIIDYLENFNEK